MRVASADRPRSHAAARVIAVGIVVSNDALLHRRPLDGGPQVRVASGWIGSSAGGAITHNRRARSGPGLRMVWAVAAS